MNSNLTLPSVFIPLALASLILLTGVVDDLRTRKFHNWLFLVCTLLAIATSVVIGGTSGLMTGALGFVAGFAVLLPFVLMGMVGAGDMKLMAAFGACAGWEAVLAVVVFSFIWGALFGVTRTVLSGQFKTLVLNIVAIATMKDRKNLVLQKIPFTIAILMGWMTDLVYRGVL
jgi:prepilin peptidase CpaA